TTTRMLNSFRMHWAMAGGSSLTGCFSYHSVAVFVPDAVLHEGLPFRLLIDHLSRTLLGRVSTSRLLHAACVGCDIEPDELITASHALVRSKFPRLLGVLLDSPAHLSR
ncbi:MAG: hypothetical protein QOK15_2641, partial [Nocardioidaceae bacterium]|nr:hypothetical protein [Nocardioidaceae bacterium]